MHIHLQAMHADRVRASRHSASRLCLLGSCGATPGKAPPNGFVSSVAPPAHVALEIALGAAPVASPRTARGGDQRQPPPGALQLRAIAAPLSPLSAASRVIGSPLRQAAPSSFPTSCPPPQLAAAVAAPSTRPSWRSRSTARCS